MSTAFHEMSATEFRFRALRGDKWRDVQRDHHEPTWCNYPSALAGAMGCWSLVGRLVTGEDYCRSCECYQGRHV